MKLDAKAVARVALPDGKADAIFFDDNLPGFGLRLRAAGGGRILGTWVAQYRAHGRTRRMKIGTVEKLGADQARKAAKKILAKVELGKDPQGDKVEDRRKASRTLRAIVELFLEAQASRLRPASLRLSRLFLTGPYFKPLHSTAATDITLADVAARVSAITRNNGSTTAARARSALSALYRWAMGEGLLGPNPVNPVAGTNKPKDSEPRDRVLKDHELAAIWNAGDGEYAHVLKLLILTGCRREEIGGLRWSEIDLDKGALALPKERVKNNRAHSLPLPPLALSIIQSVPRRASRDLLFGSRSRSPGFCSWAAAKGKLDAKLAGKVAPWRVHDLRRTTATKMADIGIQPHIIEQILNHQSGHKRGPAGIYNRSSYQREVSAALALWADHMQSIIDGRERKIMVFHKSA
jgi:integrase